MVDEKNEPRGIARPDRSPARSTRSSSRATGYGSGGGTPPSIPNWGPQRRPGPGWRCGPCRPRCGSRARSAAGRRSRSQVRQEEMAVRLLPTPDRRALWDCVAARAERLRRGLATTRRCGRPAAGRSRFICPAVDSWSDDSCDRSRSGHELARHRPLERSSERTEVLRVGRPDLAPSGEACRAA